MHTALHQQYNADPLPCRANALGSPPFPSYPQWPSLLRPLSPAILELPTMVQDKYRACQAMCFCGLFPHIRRAWASVDNSLFLWRYDRRCVPRPNGEGMAYKDTIAS